MKKKSREERRKDDIKVLIDEAKVRNDFNESELSRYLGISTTTLTGKKGDPGKLTLETLWILLELTGKEMKFVERAGA